MLPLLHRPSFERAVAEDLHFRDHKFAGVVLLVCAIGAHWSTDTRTRIKPDLKYSNGWKYFSQVPLLRKSWLNPPSLYDIQTCAVSLSPTAFRCTFSFVSCFRGLAVLSSSSSFR